MSSDRGTIIAKRSVSLSKTYPIIGVLLAIVGLVISSVAELVGATTASSALKNVGSSSARLPNLPLLAVPLQALAALIFATPVLLLFVYDKNNGVLEYLLSLGMDQKDVYRQYLKAALILSLTIVIFSVIIDSLAGVIEGTDSLMLEVSGLVAAISLAAVSFGTIIMMSFSSLQKQRVGSNQPLGMAIGVFMVMPAYLSALIVPSLAFEIDLSLAAVIVALSLLMYFLSSKVIRREKLLP
jgi:hypothetical protein